MGTTPPGPLAHRVRSSVLGSTAWPFALRSLRRRYGLLFLRRVILRHPLATLRAALRYVRSPAHDSASQEVVTVFAGSEEEFMSRQLSDRTALLVAVGFCQKPLQPECPAGRPNHDCTYLGQLNLGADDTPTAAACSRCPVKEIGTLALKAGACVYIMTSAEDIALDVMIPSLEERKFSSFVMALCPYSVRVIALPLFICGLEGYLMAYHSGDCANWEQWLRADKGIKEEVTVLGPAARRKMVSLLRAIGETRREQGCQYERFERRGRVYASVPAETTGLRDRMNVL